MTFTERYFAFPAKIYDKEQVGDMVKESFRQSPDEEKLNITPAWVKGWVRLPFDELKCWHDDTDEEDPELVSRKGHELTLVITHTVGAFECLWKRERFEEELNKAFRSIEEYVEELKNHPFKTKKPGI